MRRSNKNLLELSGPGAEMSIAKQSGFNTRIKTKVLEKFEKYADEDTGSNDATSNHAATDDGYPTLKESHDNAKGSSGKDTSRE